MKLIDILMVIFVALAWAKPAYAQKTPAQLQAEANRAMCEELSTRIAVTHPAKVKEEQATFIETCTQEKNLIFRRQITDRCQRATAGMKLEDPTQYKNCMGSFGLE